MNEGKGIAGIKTNINTANSIEEFRAINSLERDDVEQKIGDVYGEVQSYEHLLKDLEKIIEALDEKLAPILEHPSPETNGEEGATRYKVPLGDAMLNLNISPQRRIENLNDIFKRINI